MTSIEARLKTAADFTRPRRVEVNVELLDLAVDEITKLRREVDVLRICGNKDCTAMADEILEGRDSDGD